MVFNLEEIKERFAKFGTIYTSDDIQEEVEDIIGLEEKKEMMEDFFLSLKKYEELAGMMKKAKITPNFTMLLYGPPGTGKTALTRAMAKRYDITLGLVDADRLVSPLLGDTVKNIRGVFELSSEIAKENGTFILFFDEIDAVTGERANSHEVGEIKRAVISFLQLIDQVSYSAVPLAIFGATNHSNQLDSAVWRRFTYHLHFNFPNFIVRSRIIKSFLERVENATIGVEKRIFTSLAKEIKFLEKEHEEAKHNLGRELTETEISNLFEKAYKKGLNSLLYYTQGYTGADLMRAMRVALFKGLKKSMLDYDDYIRALQLVGGTKSHVLQGQKLANVAPIKSTLKNTEDEDDFDGLSSSDDLDLDIDL